MAGNFTTSAAYKAATELVFSCAHRPHHQAAAIAQTGKTTKFRRTQTRAILGLRRLNSLAVLALHP